MLPGVQYDKFKVSIHAPAGGATSYERCSRSASCCFNPRARGRRDLRGCRVVADLRCFNPRARGRRDFTFVIISIAFSLFQSTRPREARRHIATNNFDYMAVSIHAPAGGATQTSREDRKFSERFNPRARGRRDKVSYNVTTWLLVSIHAPAGGATRYYGRQFRPCSRFNPRARGRRDLTCLSLLERSSRFNPRARGRRDFNTLTLVDIRICFNPRARGRRDTTATRL